MFAKAMRLLDSQQRVERAEALMRDIGLRLRESPEDEELRQSYRSASRSALMARRALMDVIIESSEYAGPRGDELPIPPGNADRRGSLPILQPSRLAPLRVPRRA